MTSAAPAKPSRILLKIEMLLCFGPTFLYLLSGVVVVPHQLLLLVSEGVVESVWVLLYYAGITAMFVAVRSMYNHVTGDPIGILQPRSTWVCIAVGLAALAMGPVGTWLLGGRETMVPALVIPFAVLPAFCLLHLAVLSRSYLLDTFR